MKLVILGATGATGLHVVEHALHAGHEVTALVRDPGKLAARDKLTVVKGDVTSTADIEKVVAGKDALIAREDLAQFIVDETVTPAHLKTLPLVFA